MKKKLILFFIGLAVFLAGGVIVTEAARLIPSSEPAEKGVEAGKEMSATCLVLGLDDAACNTDLVLLARYDALKKRCILLQIPRDTYLENGVGHPKLNHIYAACIAAGQSAEEAARQTANTLADALGITVDVCVALRPSALSRAVDEMGGVPIDIPFDMTYEDSAQNLLIRLPAGERILTGEEAVQFVRYRSSYVQGDLGRIDAQKLFLASFLKTASEKMTPAFLFSVFCSTANDLAVYGNVISLFPTVISLLQNPKDTQILFASMPGEATRYEKDSGAWYFVINCEASKALLSEYFGIDGDAFDTRKLFCADQAHFEDIYGKKGISPRVFTEDDLTQLKILVKE